MNNAAIDFLYLRIPELKNIDTQLYYTAAPNANVSPNDISNLQNILIEAESKLSTIDKTNTGLYVSSMQNVIMLRERYSILTTNSSSNYNSLIQQKITLLENTINSTPTQLELQSMNSSNINTSNLQFPIFLPSIFRQ